MSKIEIKSFMSLPGLHAQVTDTQYLVGEYVGTSFRVKRSFQTYQDAKTWLSEYLDNCVFRGIPCPRLYIYQTKVQIKSLCGI